MERLILNVTNKSKMPFLLELLKHMEFVEVVKPGKFTARENEILNDLDAAIDQVNLHKKGKIQLKTIQQVLDEL